MTTSALQPPRTLLQALCPTRRFSLAQKVVLLLGASMALAISSKMQIAVGPVPFTMQTYVVLVIGALLGWRLGGLAIALYLLEGLCGLPVFANGGGPAYLFSPTFGFLVGFIPSAMLIGYATEQGYVRTWASSLLWMSLAHLLLFVFGTLWLVPVFGIEKAMAVGFITFLFASAVKTLLAMATVSWAWKKLQ